MVLRRHPTLSRRLLHKRLAQILPWIGGALAASSSYTMPSSVQRDAARIYRARYHCDKYGMSFEDWAAQTKAWSDADDATTDYWEAGSAAARPRERRRLSLTSSA